MDDPVSKPDSFVLNRRKNHTPVFILAVRTILISMYKS